MTKRGGRNDKGEIGDCYFQGNVYLWICARKNIPLSRFCRKAPGFCSWEASRRRSTAGACRFITRIGSMISGGSWG